jgi:transposase-like protein
MAASTTNKSEQVRQLLATGMSAADIARKVGCTTGLVYNLKSKGGGAARRGPGRPRKAAAAAGTQGIAGILQIVQQNERERGRLRAALQRIQEVVSDVLG